MPGPELLAGLIQLGGEIGHVAEGQDVDGAVRHLVVTPVLAPLQKEDDAALDLPSFGRAVLALDAHEVLLQHPHARHVHLQADGDVPLRPQGGRLPLARPRRHLRADHADQPLDTVR